MAIDPVDTNHFYDDNNRAIKPTPATNQARVRSSDLPASIPHSPTQDVLHVSSEQNEYNHLVSAIKQVPDIREEKVKKIKEALDSGTYQISSEDIADRIIQDSIIHSTRTSR